MNTKAIVTAIETLWRTGERNESPLFRVAFDAAGNANPASWGRVFTATIERLKAETGEEVEEANVEFAPTDVPRLTIQPDGADAIDALALEVTKGTKLPFAFARETFKQFLLAGLRPTAPTLPWFHILHKRQYVILVSDVPGTGKGESFRRAKRTLERDGCELEFIDGGKLGSPEYACVALGGTRVSANGKEIKRKRKPNQLDPLAPPAPISGRIVHFDEGKKLFQKDSVGQGSERGLLTFLTSLFDSNEASSGSFKNGEAELKYADVSLMMHFTRDGFDKCFLGSGATRDGFLSRCSIIDDRANPIKGVWPPVDGDKVKSLMLVAKAYSQRTQLPEDADAETLRLEYTNKLRMSDPMYSARLEFLFVQDVYARAIFSADGRITAAKVQRAIAWADHQLLTRQVLWPFDSSADKGERMYHNLRAAYQKHGKLTHTQAKRLCNVGREGTGGAETYLRAHRSMLVSGEIANAGVTRQRRPLFEWCEP